MQTIENIVADVAARKKVYVPPQIEVVELEQQPSLLAGSPTQFGSGFRGIDRDEDEW